MQGNVRVDTSSTTVEPYHKWAFDQFLTYSALGGLIVTDEGKVERLPIYQFCQRVNIDQKTTWRWKHMPDFGEQVRLRRNEIMPVARESMVYNQLFLLTMQTQDKRAAVEAIKLWTGHFGDLKLPTVKQEVKVEGNFLDMMANAAQQGIIEGEVVDANLEPQTDTGGSAQDTGALPPTS